MSRIVQSPHWLRRRTVRAAFVAGVAVISVAGTAVAVAASPRSAAAPARIVPARAGSPAGSVPAVDHQLCYTAKGQYKIPRSIELFNQFSPRGFVPKIGAVASLCNPVVKTLPDGKRFGVTNAAGHLVCFQIKAEKPQPAPLVQVANQFGSASLITGQPNALCLPSWKSLKGPPKEKVAQPPRLSHFTCYPVKLAPGSAGFANVPSFVLLRDEFGSGRAKVSKVPTELCLPTKKVVGKKVFKILNPVAHLLCFPVSPTPSKPRVWAQNQFGTSVLSVSKTRTLCLPSAKRILPPVNHQLCYTGQAASAFKIPGKIELINQFSPGGFTPKIGAAVLHCNPVVKTLAHATFPITNQNAHLLCFRMAAAQQPTPEVRVTNQFGTALLLTSQPNLLCLPSWKSLKGPPQEKVSQPPGLSHFTCYPVKVVPGTPGYKPPAKILLQDEFAPKPIQVQVSPVPQELCLPTEKVVTTATTGTVQTFPNLNPIMHLLCYPVSKTEVVPKVWDQNQFGTSEILIGQTTWLCLPSFKTVVPPTP